MSLPGHRAPAFLFVILLASTAFALAALVPWHPDPRVRRAAAIVLVALIFWISEIVPLGITGLLIPVWATLAGVLTWSEALSAWGDQILFLFLGAFLLARALEKHGVFEGLLQAAWATRFRRGSGVALAILVMLVAGAVSMIQSNTAVAAMLLPVVLGLARAARNPPLVVLALSYGATFGGMATPVGTPPNLIGYAAMKQCGEMVSFLTWLRVGLPIWLGTSMLAGAVLLLAGKIAPRGNRAPAPEAVGTPVLARPPDPAPAVKRRRARDWALAAFACTVVIWLGSGAVVSAAGPSHPAAAWMQRYWPESLAPIFTAGLLFLVRAGPGRVAVLERRDFQTLDWDTLFLIAGGLCLGKMLQNSGAAAALAGAMGGAQVSHTAAMLGLGAVTVLLSELTSNTATAALMVPIASSLAPAVGLPPAKAIWLVALCASLGFALPVSTPPNAIVYGTGLVPLRTMIALGIVVDVLALLWVIQCVRWFG